MVLSSPPVDHDALIDMLSRLKLTAIRDQLDTLLDDAARRELTLRETLAFLCQRWGLAPLGARCAAALATNPFQDLFLPSPRLDTPAALPTRPRAGVKRQRRRRS